MRWGGSLNVRAAVSRRLLDNVDRIQRAFLGETDRFHHVEVAAPAAASAKTGPGDGVACFFTGGVDSFYSVLSHRDEITHLVYVHGYDIPLGETRLRGRVSQGLQSAARELGLPLIEVESDVRMFSDRRIDWTAEYHGAALASIALFLAPRFRKVYIASSFAPASMQSWGSMPPTDPLWSTEDLEVVHDLEVLRQQKINFLAGSPIALRWLRPCWEYLSGAYNCGRCEKCLRTMVALRLAGALDACRVFDRPLDLKAVARIPITSSASRIFLQENIDAADHAHDEELALALRKAARRAGTPLARIDRAKKYVRDVARHRVPALAAYVEARR
jgi:hypothetical protein